MFGMVIALLTFPGVIVHEMAHLLCCRLFGVRVHKVCYFRIGNPAGYVLHDVPDSAWQYLLIGIGPFFLNSFLGVLICAPVTLHPQQIFEPWQFLLITWLGISVAMHAFPSSGDARAIWQVAWRRATPWTAKLICTPIVALIYLLALGSMFWLDLVYAVLITSFVPRWVLNW